MLVSVDRVDRWLTDDSSWFLANRALLDIVFDVFMRDGEWPEVAALRRLLHQRGIKGIDVQAVANTKPAIPAQLTMAIQERISLGVRHLRHMPKAAHLLDLLVHATNEGVRAYSSNEEHPAVRYDNPDFFRFDSETIIHFLPLVTADYPNPFGGGNYGDEWVLFVNDALILEFEGVESPDDYFDRQVSIIRKWVERTTPPSDPTSAANWNVALLREQTGAANGNPDDAISSEKVFSMRSVVFIVHGHDTKLLKDVALTVERLTGEEAVILHEQPNRGRTIIEKFECHASDAGFVVVLATADDLGQAKDAKEMQSRARQNVVFELGYFIGALGRNRVTVLHDQEVELPSDMAGVLYIPNDSSGEWRLKLAEEMRAAGLDVDANGLEQNGPL